MTQNDSLIPTPPTTEREYLTLQDLATLCHVSYKIVRQFADKECVQDFMCAYKHPSSKGFRWPLDCEPKWRMLLDAAQKGLIQPLNVAAWLQNLEISGGLAQSQSMGHQAELQTMAQSLTLGNDGLSLGKEALELLRQLVQQSAFLCDRQESLSAPEDALLTLAEARARYGLSLSTLRALSVLDGGRRKVKVSVIRHKIATL